MFTIKKSISCLFLLSAILLLSIGCNSTKRINKDFNYLQRGLDSVGTVKYEESTIQPNDVLFIQVFSGTVSQEQAALFNLSNFGVITTTGNAISPGGTLTTGYQVDLEGNIEMPLIGKVMVKGLTKEQLVVKLNKLLESYVKEPNTLVRYLYFKVNVLGEVKKPGPVLFKTDKVNLIEALSEAGDLTDYGRRENVMVIREVEGKRTIYTVDLRDGKFFQSPAFQLQQNDVIYVSANTIKLKSVNIDPNFQRDLQTTLSVLSMLAILLSVMTYFKN